METTNIFQQYAEIQQEIKGLEDKKRQLSDMCLDKMKEDGQDSFKNGLGTYTITKRNRYEYSVSVKAKETEVRSMKQLEEKSGVAKSTITESLMFRKMSEEKDKGLKPNK